MTRFGHFTELITNAIGALLQHSVLYDTKFLSIQGSDYEFFHPEETEFCICTYTYVCQCICVHNVCVCVLVCVRVCVYVCTNANLGLKCSSCFAFSKIRRNDP